MPQTVWMRLGEGAPEEVAYEPHAIAAKMRAGYRQCAPPGKTEAAKPGEPEPNPKPAQ